MFTRFAIIALAAVTLIAGTLAAFAAGDGGSDDAVVANVELRKPEDATPADVVEDDRGDDDDTRGDDGTDGGDTTGDGDRSGGNDGTAGGDNTAAAATAPAQPAPAPYAEGDDSNDGVSAGGATT